MCNKKEKSEKISSEINDRGLTSVQGFEFAGISTDKDKEKNNLGLVFSTVEETYGVAVYTQSDVLAAPVIVSKGNDKITHKKRAVLINSGKANAFTGKKGIQDADALTAEISQLLNIKQEEVYIGSTGVIGQKLDIHNLLKEIKRIPKELGGKEANARNFVEAMMTTDTKMKQFSISFEINEKKINIASCVKGAGMIMPDMATMLCLVITDAKILPTMMSKALNETVKDTFNCITVDGDTSTNDSVFFLSNGLANNEIIDCEASEYQEFTQNLRLLLEHTAKALVNDGEGITKFITIKVVHTPTKRHAKTIAFSIGNSPLVKTTFYGQQLNWGRLLMAIGKAQTKLDCSFLDIYINGYKVVEDGEAALSTRQYEKAEQSLINRNVDILIDFKQGTEQVTVWTCDYSIEYIKINANYIT